MGGSSRRKTAGAKARWITGANRSAESAAPPKSKNAALKALCLPKANRKTQQRSRQWQLQKTSGVEVDALPANPDIKVGTGGAPRSTTEPYHLPAFDRVAFFYFELGKMQVEREQALAVINYHEIAFVVQKPRQQHRAAVHRCDGSSSVDAEIQAVMSAQRFAVENALDAKHVGNVRLRRRGELPLPPALGRDASQVFLLYFLGFFNLLLLFGIWLGKLALNAQLARD